MRLLLSDSSYFKFGNIFSEWNRAEQVALYGGFKGVDDDDDDDQNEQVTFIRLKPQIYYKFVQLKEHFYEQTSCKNIR